MHSAVQQQQGFFLRDAFAQLDAVLAKKREVCETGGQSDAELKRAQQVIQRWLVIFARQHLYNICIKLMDAAKAADAAAEAAAAEKPVRRRKQLLPSLSKADDDDDIESAASAPSDAEHIDSESYFVLDCLRRVLSAAADVTGSRGDGLGGYTILDDENLVGARGGLGKLGTQGGAAALAPGPGSVATGDALAPLRGAPDGLLAFCYSRVHVSRPSPIRTVASECVGILSLVALKPLVTMLIEGMNKVASDRDEREWVAYQRAARLIHLSTHSAEQAGASLRYLKAVASAMSRTNRGVLRLEICRSLTSSLERLMAPADESSASEWGEYCAGASAGEWWAAYATAYGHAARWASRKPAHAHFCFELMTKMLSLASRQNSGPEGAVFASTQRHHQLLLLLCAALRRDAQRILVLPIAADYITALPPSFVADDIGDPSTAVPPSPSILRTSDHSLSFSSKPVTGNAESQLRTLITAVLPRRAALSQKEATYIQATLLALGRHPAGVESLLVVIRDMLRDHASPLATRALLLRVLATLAEENPTLVDAHREVLWPLAVAPLQAAAGIAAAVSAAAAAGIASGASAAGEPSNAGEKEILSAALLCLPALWPLSDASSMSESSDLSQRGDGASKHEPHLHAVASLIRCEARELCLHASLCLRALIARRPSELAAPVLLAVGRMLLSCDGSALSELQRALSIAHVLADHAVDTLLGPDHATSVHNPKGRNNDDGDTDDVDQETSATKGPMLTVHTSNDEGDGPTVEEWQQVREVLQAVCLACSYHHLPEVCSQAAVLLATFDQAAARQVLPPPVGRITLLQILPAGWGDGASGVVGSAALEAALCVETGGPHVHSLELGSSVPLAWAALWRQAQAGPRLLPPGSTSTAAIADGLTLWRRQLRFLALYARYPQPAPSRTVPVVIGGDRGSDVEAFMRRLVWWVLHGHGSRVSAVLEALRLAHIELVPEAVRQLRTLATERAETPSRGGGLSIFGGGGGGAAKHHGGSTPNDGLPDVFFDSRVLRMLAEAFGRIPTAVLADVDNVGMSHLRATLEQLCSVWLREKHSADATTPSHGMQMPIHGHHGVHHGGGGGGVLAGRVESKNLIHTAGLLGAYFRLIALRARERERAASNAALLIDDKEVSEKPSKQVAKPASLSFVRNALELLQSWMSLACLPLPTAASARGSKDSAGGSDARVVVLSALEALLAVRPLGQPNADDPEIEKGLESDVRHFLDALLLSAPVLAPHVRRALAAHLRHNGGHDGRGLALFMRKSLRGAHRSAGGAGVDAGAGALARAYFSAIVDCADGSGEGGYDGGLAAARQADARISAQLLLLALLHQGAQDAPMRELGARLARAICPLSHEALTAAPHAAAPHAAIAGGPAPTEPLLYSASAFRYSAALAAAPRAHEGLPALLSVLVERFTQLSLPEREDALLLLMPWLQTFGARTPQLLADDELGTSALNTALSLYFALTRLCSAAASPGLMGETAQVRFLLEAGWAALATPANAPMFATVLHSLLLDAHMTAAEPAIDTHEQALCVRVLLLTLRTPAAPDLLSALLGSLRAYGPDSPSWDRPASEWLAWRAPRVSRARPLTPTELSAFEMLPALPHEVPALLRPHLPTLLHTCVVCHGGEPGTDRADGRSAEHAVQLLDALVANLAPDGDPGQPGRRLERACLSMRGLPRGLAAVRPLVLRLGGVAPSLARDWRALSLCWALHAEDPDLSLTSLRVFALLNTQVNPELLHALALALWGALRDDGRAKAQLLLRLMIELPPLADSPLGERTWLLLAETAAALLASRAAHLFEEAAKLLLATLAAQGTDGPSEVMLAKLAEVWRGAEQRGLPPGAEHLRRPLEEVLSHLLLKGLAGEEASAECRATTLLALETLAEDYSDLMPPNNRLVIAVLFCHTLAVMLGQADAAPRAAAFLERCGSALAERLLDLFRSTKLPRAVTEELRAAMGPARGNAVVSGDRAIDADVADVMGAFARNFAERFFGAFALAFSSHDNCDFALLLLSSWLAAGCPWDDHRPGGRARTTREVALLWMLQGLLRQFAPHDVAPAQFEALAPLVVAAFHSRRPSVSAAAEALLSEMVARAPRGTPPSIFALTAAKPEPQPPPWCGPLVSAGDEEGRPSLLAAAALLQVHALGVSLSQGPPPLRDDLTPALAAVAQLPDNETTHASMLDEESEDHPGSPVLSNAPVPLSSIGVRSSCSGSSLPTASLPGTPRSRASLSIVSINAPSPSASEESGPFSPNSLQGNTPNSALQPRPAATVAAPVVHEEDEDDDSDLVLSCSSEDDETASKA